jgi:enoyl-CoA hydratase/carnithine racemase
MEPDYFGKYPTIDFSRDANGILVMRLHSNGGPVFYAAQHHSDWCRAFHEVGCDRDNRVVIITGTGDAFINQIGWNTPIDNALDWDRIYWEGKRFIRHLLDIEVPVIGAINGPATVHAELALLSDITIAADTATFQDAPHVQCGATPGDGVHVLWQELLGINRGRYFLLTGQTLSAEQALALGVVNEVVTPAQLMPRVMDIATGLAALPPLTLRYSRVLLTHRIKRLFDEMLGYGLALEGLAALQPSADKGR